VRVVNGSLDEREVHFRTAFGIVRDLRGSGQSARNSQLSEFRWLWYQTAPYWLSLEWLTAQQVREDNRLLILRGRYHEYWMGPEICCGGNLGFQPRLRGDSPRRETSHGRFDLYQAGRAEADFRDYLRIDPTHTETRLRLGRVLYLLDRVEEARQAFEVVLRSAQRDSFSAYLSALFLGQLREDQGRSSAAADLYRQAIAILPSGQAASLSLGRLALSSGQMSEGWGVIRGSLTSMQRSDNQSVDPWYAYGFDRQPWQRDRLLRELRAMTRVQR
jgi:tetratricopeptide (TPR) repeat protein